MKFFQIIGTQRSGSNLFRLMLNEFQNVFAPHPPHLLNTFYPLLEKYNDLNNDKNLKRLISDMLGWINNNPIKWSDVPTAETIFNTIKNRNLFEIFKAIYTSNNPNFWCCKSLQNLKFYNIKEFQDLNPIYIYIYRDGRDVASSFKNAPIGDKHIYFLAKKWAYDQHVCNEIKKITPNEHFFSVRYEDLLEDPASILNNLCDRYDIIFNKDFLNFYLSKESLKASKSGGMWKNLSKPLIRDNKEKFKRELSDNEILIFESINKNILKELGYKLQNDNSSLDISFSSEDIDTFKSINNEIISLIKSNNKLSEIDLRIKQRDELSKSIG